jgi:hypothetical protein
VSCRLVIAADGGHRTTKYHLINLLRHSHSRLDMSICGMYCVHVSLAFITWHAHVEHRLSAPDMRIVIRLIAYRLISDHVEVIVPDGGHVARSDLVTSDLSCHRPSRASAMQPRTR